MWSPPPTRREWAQRSMISIGSWVTPSVSVCSTISHYSYYQSHLGEVLADQPAVIASTAHQGLAQTLAVAGRPDSGVAAPQRVQFWTGPSHDRRCRPHPHRRGDGVSGP